MLSKKKSQSILEKTKELIDIDNTGRGVFLKMATSGYSICVETDVEKDHKCIQLGWLLEEWHYTHEKGIQLLSSLINYGLIEARLRRKKQKKWDRAEIKKVKQLKK